MKKIVQPVPFFILLPLIDCGIEKAALSNGETILIQGAGGLGLYATAVAKEKDARVIVVDAIAGRLDMAADFGAEDLVDGSERSSQKSKMVICWCAFSLLSGIQNS